MKPGVVRLTAAILAGTAIALAGCGSDVRDAAPVARQAPDPERTQDLVPLTTAQAARAADDVALVTSRGSRVIEGAPGTPFTRTTFEVQDVLKGKLPRTFVLQVIGGRMGETVVRSPVPAFAPSRRYVVFLGRGGPTGPTIIPQATVDVDKAGRAGLRRALASIRRSLP